MWNRQLLLIEKQLKTRNRMKQKSDIRNTLSSCWSFIFKLKRFTWAYSEVCLLSLCTSFLPRDNQVLVYSEKFAYTVVKKRQMSNIELRNIFCFTPSFRSVQCVYHVNPAIQRGWKVLVTLSLRTWIPCSMLWASMKR